MAAIPKGNEERSRIALFQTINGYGDILDSLLIEA